jgi:hypothetical protein
MIGLAALTVAAWLLAMSGGSAWATTGHTFVGQFGGLGTGDGQFGEPLHNGPVGITVMPSTGEVFTTDAAQVGGAMPRVQRFSAEGVFQSSFAIEAPYNDYPGPVAVDSAGSGAVYVSTRRPRSDEDPFPIAVVVKYSVGGAFAYELDAATSGTTINAAINGPAPMAVDPVDGTVYVSATRDDGQAVIDRFDGTTGAFVDALDGSNGSPGGGFCSPTSVAIDGLHRVYVVDACRNRVDRFGGDGSFEETLGLPLRDGSPEVPSAVAVDPASDEVYVAHSGPTGMQVTHFSSGADAAIYTFDAPDVGGVRGMAVSGAGTVYTSDASQPFVERFARFGGPTVVTGDAPAGLIEARSAVLEGTIDPEGVSSSYHFEYGTAPTSLGSRTDDVAVGSGSDPISGVASIDGLEPNKTYFFRIVGSNDSGSIVGVPRTFVTLPAPPDVGPSVSASAITSRTVRLHGTVNPNNSFAPYHFEYGTTTAYGNSEPGGVVNGFFPPIGTYQPVQRDLTGLEPGTTYHFRLVANAFGGEPQAGSDQTFVTAPAAGSGATNVTSRRARLMGTINPHGVATTYHFNYGTTESYGSSTPEVDGGIGDDDQLVTEEIAGLLPDTTYHVQVVATSADGVVRSSGDGRFQTATAPGAIAIAPTGISTNSATLVGDVNTFGLTGSYHFDVWSLDSSYTASTPERSVAGNASAERVNAALSDLPAGETLVLQLSVSSNDSVSVSDVLTFATAEVAKVFPSPPVSDGSSLYGCASPRLDAYDGRPKPGQTIAITGQDLGVGGSVVLGDRPLKPTDWSATGFKVLIPLDIKEPLALTVNCGHRSNTIAVAVFQEPENGFVITRRSVVGSTAMLKLRVPGPGKLESSGSGTRTAKVAIKKPGTATIRVKLTSAGARALVGAASHTRRVKVRVRFTPAGGRPASKMVTITFKRKAGR